MATHKPKVISEFSVGFLEISINGKSVTGGGVSYSRTEYADGTVVEDGRTVDGSAARSPGEIIGAALAALAGPENPAAAPAAAAARLATSARPSGRGRGETAGGSRGEGKRRPG